MSLGRIELILGPMFAGKSNELMRRVRRHRAAKHRCVVVKYAGDTRYTTEAQLLSHSGQQEQALVCGKQELIRLCTLHADIQAADVVAIDEGQFYEHLSTACESLAARGKIVIVAALDGTFDLQPFPAISELIPLADDYVKLTAVCMRCGQDAPYSHRLDSADTSLEVIGGADRYEARCRKCFLA